MANNIITEVYLNIKIVVNGVISFKSCESQLSFDRDLDTSSLVVESASLAITDLSTWSLRSFAELLGDEKVGRASVKGEEASIVGLLTGLLKDESSSSLQGADRFRVLSYE